MAARSLLRPMRRRVRTGTLIALRLIGAGLMLLPSGRGVVESGSTGAPPAPPSTQLSGTGGAPGSAATPLSVLPARPPSARDAGAPTATPAATPAAAGTSGASARC